MGETGSSESIELETFVIVHSDELVLACEAEGRFADLPSYRYLFVGHGDVSRLQHLDVIVARDLPDNIEQHVHLLSFTGWYAVARNSLTDARWVALLEYDVSLAPDFFETTLDALQTGRRLVGYIPFPLTHHMYLGATPWLSPVLAKVHGIDVEQVIQHRLAAGGDDMWTATTNQALAGEDLRQFVDWFLPASVYFRHDPVGAHVHERTLPMFCETQGIENVLIPDVLEHRQQRSHGIIAFQGDAVPHDPAELVAEPEPEPAATSRLGALVQKIRSRPQRSE